MRIQLTFGKFLVPLCAAALSIITFGNVNAELTQADLVPGSSDGLLIRDSSSQLEWLRLTETQGLSVVDVIDDGVGGYADLGFELANVEQVENLSLLQE
jgi:hypothetical protein